VSDDRLIRAAVFGWLERLTSRYGDEIPWSELKRGVDVDGRNVQVLGPQGIFTPAGLRIPLSITTAPVKRGQARPYEDNVEEDGMLRYRYRGVDPQHRDNAGLRRAYVEATPLVYFHGIASGKYQAFWPVFIHDDDPASLTFTVAFEDPQVLRPDLSPMVVDEARRSYTSRLARRRLHQAAFRYRVISAYSSACAICRLKHVELLDAAHILPDGHPLGTPVVPNGLALCKIHHAAYDANILGILPDSVVEIRSDVLEEVDGPMLRYGLQAANGSKLTVPKRAEDRPNQEFLLERYEAFRAR
jgi:putative restriction endonuclease